MGGSTPVGVAVVDPAKGAATTTGQTGPASKVMYTTALLVPTPVTVVVPTVVSFPVGHFMNVYVLI